MTKHNFLRLACLLTGDDYKLVTQDTPESRKKIILLAEAMLLPTTLWFICGWLFSSMILGLQLGIALLIGLIAAYIVLKVERVIALSHRSKSFLIMRAILAICLALFGSITMDEVIFHEDIERRMVELQRHEAEQSMQRVRVDSEIELASLASLRDKRYDDWQRALKAANDEADGSGGSGKKGVDAITRQKMLAADRLEEVYHEAQNQVDQHKAEMQARMDRTQAEIINQATSGGLLYRFNVLLDMIKENPPMLLVMIVFSVFMFIIELLVVMVKMQKKQSHYEMKLETMDLIGKERMRKTMERDQQVYNPSSRLPQVRDAMKGLHQNERGFHLFN